MFLVHTNVGCKESNWYYYCSLSSSSSSFFLLLKMRIRSHADMETVDKENGKYVQCTVILYQCRHERDAGFKGNSMTKL